MECVSSVSHHGRSTRCRTAQTQRQRSDSAKRQRVRMESLERSIRQIHSPPSIGGSTRSRNSALRWKDRASSPVPAVANTPYRQRACAAPCRSPTQTSICEQTSHRSFYLAVRSRAPVPSGSCFIPASIAVLHASLSSALFSLRQVVISSALGINAQQSLSTSGVHVVRCSGVPCGEGGSGRGRLAQQGQRHAPLRQIGRSIQLFWLSMFIRGLACIIEADTRHRHHGR